MVLTEIAFKVHVVLFNFSWESFVILKSSFLIVTLLVASIVLNNTVELLLKHANSFDWVFSNISSEIWTKLSQVI